MTAWLVAGCAALLGLHLLEPALPLAWGFAGLRATWGSIVPGVLAALVIPPVVALAWRSERARAPWPRLRPAWVVAATLTTWLGLSLVGLAWPAPHVCPDVLYLPHQLRTSGAGTPRWLLSVPLFQLFFAPLRGLVTAETALRVTNALFSTLSVLLTLAIAARVGRSVREVLAVLLLVWTALGSLQLALGYIDVYPLVQLVVALYLWTALRFLDGDGSVAWPVAVAAVAPVVYVGLVLLGPSVLVLAWHAWRRATVVPFLAAAAAGFLVAGLATIPAYGAPFAFVPWITRLANADLHGLNPDGQTLPLSYMLSLRHAGEVLSTLVLLDGTALVLVAGLSPRTRHGAFLWCILAAGLAFVVAMDPLWGPYSDWDLFSYLTLPLSVGGALAFLTLSRSRPRFAGLVLGLALATSAVHLLARLNTLDSDFERHIAASPYHMKIVPNGFFKPRRD